MSEGVAGSGVPLAGRNTCGHRADGANGIEKPSRGVASSIGGLDCLQEEEEEEVEEEEELDEAGGA